MDAARNLAANELSEYIAFCDVVVRLCPKLNYAELFTRMQQERVHRRTRLRRLHARVNRGTYFVPAGAVAHALLRELDPGWPS
jgi:hypothetical protein